MKKIIIRTAVITLCGVLAFIALLYGALTLFAPKALANFWGGLGSDNLAKTFSEKQYEKTEDISDLYNLIVVLDAEEDAEKVVLYTEKLLNEQGFKEFCSQNDVSGAKISTVQYVSVKYVYSLVSLNQQKKALEFSKEFVSEFGYTEYNPLRTLFNDLLYKLDQETKEETFYAVIDAYELVTDSAQKELIEKDIKAKTE